MAILEPSDAFAALGMGGPWNASAAVATSVARVACASLAASEAFEACLPSVSVAHVACVSRSVEIWLACDPSILGGFVVETPKWVNSCPG